MLKQRVLTAIVLLSVLLPVIFYHNQFVFQLVALVFLSLAAWEWGKLSGLSKNNSIFFGCSVFFCLLINFFGVINIAHDYVLIVASIFWGFGAFLFILWKEKFLLKVPLIIMLIIGIMVFLAAWNSLIFSRQVGVNYFLSVLMLVWISDIAAYFGGKAIGRTKLAPTISPGKTWEGVFFGILGVIALAFIWILCDQYFENKNRSFFSQIFQLDFISFFMTLIFLTSIGVIGDLFESLLKRSVGLKDSSRLLPGHGGVLDRIDALLPVLTMTTFISIFIVK